MTENFETNFDNREREVERIIEQEARSYEPHPIVLGIRRYLLSAARDLKWYASLERGGFKVSGAPDKPEERALDTLNKAMQLTKEQAYEINADHERKYDEYVRATWGS